MFEVNNKSIRHCSGVFDVNFEFISHVVIAFLLLLLFFYLTWNMQMQWFILLI